MVLYILKLIKQLLLSTSLLNSDFNLKVNILPSMAYTVQSKCKALKSLSYSSHSKWSVQ